MTCRWRRTSARSQNPEPDARRRDSLRALADAKRVGAALPEPKPDEMRWLSLPHRDVTVAYRDTGPHPTGPTFLLLHGLGGTGANWDTVVPTLRAAGRVIVPDIPGFGRTEIPAEDADVTSVSAMLREFLTALEVTDVVVAGNSMGGLLGVLLAHDLAHDQEDDLDHDATPATVRISRVVLIDPVLPVDVRALPSAMVLLTFSLYLVGPLARRVVPWYVARIGLERMGIDGVVNQVGDPLRVPKWVVRRAVAETKAHAERPHAVGALVRAAGSLVGMVLRRRYRVLLDTLTQSGPRAVTLIHGERDGMVPVAVARRWARRNPHWTYREAPGIGHVPMFEVGPWVAAEIADDATESAVV